MPNKPESNYRAWLAKAGEDELSTGALVGEKAGAPSTVCFLSQQMAEKYLKGLLVFYGKEFLKVHDLIELETLLLDVDSEIQSFHEDLKTLNQYYVGTRYPTDVPEFTFKECEKAFEAALRIKEFVLEKIKSRKNEGFGIVGIIIIIAAVAVLGGGFLYLRESQWDEKGGDFGFQKIEPVTGTPPVTKEEAEIRPEDLREIPIGRLEPNLLDNFYYYLFGPARTEKPPIKIIE